MRAPLPSAAPSETGSDASGFLSFVDALDAAPAQDPHGLMILHHGRVVAEGWWAPYTADRPQLVYSLSKSFTGAAAAVLFGEGRLDLDTPVVDFFPEFADDITDERSRRILVRHVASMSAGHRGEMLDAAVTTDPDEPVRGFLLNPPECEPGSVFAYSQPTTYTLAAIVQRLTGRTLVDFLRERVLDPIGAGDIFCQQNPAGRNIGFSGSFMTTDTIARLGQLLLQRGVWDGERVLPEEWIAQASSPQVATEGDPAVSDWACGYGFQHWMQRTGFRGDGAYGQLCVVLPEHDAVIAYQGGTEDMQGLMDAVWEHVLPALSAPGSTEADDALRERLQTLGLSPLAPGDAAPDDDWDGASFAPAGLGFGVRITRDDDAWRVALTGSAGAVDAAFASDDGWRVTAGAPAVALSGGFDSPRTAMIEVAFLETPHRAVLQLDLDTAQVTTAWRTTPLDAPTDLRRLAAPGPLGGAVVVDLNARAR